MPESRASIRACGVSEFSAALLPLRQPLCIALAGFGLRAAGRASSGWPSMAGLHTVAKLALARACKIKQKGFALSVRLPAPAVTIDERLLASVAGPVRGGPRRNGPFGVWQGWSGQVRARRGWAVIAPPILRARNVSTFIGGSETDPPTSANLDRQPRPKPPEGQRRFRMGDC